MATATRERPILMSGPMVRAILEGRKGQTRRVVKMDADAPRDIPQWKVERLIERCPYGVPGDRLWVRETWATMACYDYLPPSQLSINSDPWYYRATDPPGECDELERWRPAVHMPRIISRITLEISGVRVERLHDISEDDVQAEGCTGSPHGKAADKLRFPTLWDRINGKSHPWASNPWVFVLEFRRAT